MDLRDVVMMRSRLKDFLKEGNNWMRVSVAEEEVRADKKMGTTDSSQKRERNTSDVLAAYF